MTPELKLALHLVMRNMNHLIDSLKATQEQIRLVLAKEKERPRKGPPRITTNNEKKVTHNTQIPGNQTLPPPRRKTHPRPS
jgi:hypothetical protein